MSDPSWITGDPLLVIRSARDRKDETTWHQSISHVTVTWARSKKVCYYNSNGRGIATKVQY